MAVPVFEPKVSVILKKNIGRANISGAIAASQRFQGTQRQIDLTPYLGDNSAVVVSKSVRQPAGMFSVSLADNFAPGELESLYGVIEPMDVIEIRMARDTTQYAGAFTNHMPIMMRGFVTDIRRSEPMGADGRPQRSVVINGQDYGKILQINRIVYLPFGVTGNLLLTYFKLFTNYGIGSQPDQDAGVFVGDVINKAVLPFLAQMRQAATANGVAQGISPILDIRVESKVDGGLVSPFGTNQWPGGSIYELLAYYGDVGPWNELFIEDRETAPFLVYRPTPFKDTTGKFIQDPYKSNPSTGPALNIITDAELVSIDSVRSDFAVANYYWVDNQNYQLVEGPMLQTVQNAADPASIYLTDYPNSSPFLYGFRPMMLATQQGARFDGQNESTFDQKSADAVSFLNGKRAILLANNKDNVVFESGAMKLRGNEKVRAGTILRLIRGAGPVGNELAAGFTAEYYAHSVQHVFIPYRSYTTEVTFDRGTGFIQRVQKAGPYLAETKASGVYE